jgi:hypothetical protein
VCGWRYSEWYIWLPVGFKGLITLPMTVEFKILKCGIYLVTRTVRAGEHPVVANIFIYLGFGILILYKS